MRVKPPRARVNGEQVAQLSAGRAIMCDRPAISHRLVSTMQGPHDGRSSSMAVGAGAGVVRSSELFSPLTTPATSTSSELKTVKFGSSNSRPTLSPPCDAARV